VDKEAATLQLVITMPELGTAFQQKANDSTSAGINDQISMSSEYGGEELLMATGMEGNVKTMRRLLSQNDDNIDEVSIVTLWMRHYSLRLEKQRLASLKRSSPLAGRQ
jgi:hypothetical protein